MGRTSDFPKLVSVFIFILETVFMVSENFAYHFAIASNAL